MEIKVLVARLYVRYGTRIDPLSRTTPRSMVQYATHDSVPRGLRCDVSFHLLQHGNEKIDPMGRNGSKEESSSPN